MKNEFNQKTYSFRISKFLSLKLEVYWESSQTFKIELYAKTKDKNW